MKYLLQAEHDELTKNARRYEGLISIIQSGRPTTLDLFRNKAVKRPVIDLMVDDEIARLAELSTTTKESP